MSTFRYFGYGSLINDDTRPDDSKAVNHTLKGWRREWRASGNVFNRSDGRRSLCALSVRPDPNSEIDGVLVEEPSVHLPKLDEREVGYDRFALTDLNEAYIYQIRDEYRNWASDDFPIAQSYIDCVLQGVLRRFGEEGLYRFAETTDGWGGPVLQDRGAPLYPRAVLLSNEERGQIDTLLKSL